MKAANCIAIFNSCIVKYHLKDNVDELLDSQFKEKSYEDLLYKKNWIDTVQWHLEDIIRDPNTVSYTHLTLPTILLV